jgi:hypothetical protein
MSQRFRDSGESVYDLWDHWIVPCPSCKKPVDFKDRRLSCIHCGYSKEFKEEGTWFKLVPLTVPMEHFLAIPCCGHKLWAVNLEHLDFLERYVGSQLRERQVNVNKSMASRLPQWMKDAKNRDEIIAGIGKLRTMLLENGYRPNNALRNGQNV